MQRGTPGTAAIAVVFGPAVGVAMDVPDRQAQSASGPKKLVAATLISLLANTSFGKAVALAVASAESAACAHGAEAEDLGSGDASTTVTGHASTRVGRNVAAVQVCQFVPFVVLVRAVQLGTRALASQMLV